MDTDNERIQGERGEESNGRSSDAPRMTFHIALTLLLRPLRRWWYGPPKPNEAARGMIARGLHHAFRTFRDERFRRAMRFNELEEREHDFIFNELVATSLALPILMVESISAFTNPGAAREFYHDLRKAFDVEWEVMFKGFGITSKQLRDWRKLLDLRLEEFVEVRLENRSKFPELGEGNPWTPVCAVNCLYRVRHGKRVEKDPALPLLIDLFSTCALATMKILKRHTFRI